SLLSLTLSRPPISSLFPYTTLFRSRPPRPARGAHRSHPCSRDSRQFGRGCHSRERSAAGSGQAQRTCAAARRISRQHRGALQIRSEEHTSELQSLTNLVCRLLLEKK